MAREPEDEFAAALAKFSFGAQENTTLAGRNKLAAKTVSQADRAALSASRPDRVDGQLNVKVTKEFAAMVRAMARAEGIPLAQLVRKAIEQYKTGTGQ